LAEASPEVDATIPAGASLAADVTDANSESGDGGDPHRSATPPRTAKASPEVAEAGLPPVSLDSPVSTGRAAGNPKVWLTPPVPHPGNQEPGSPEVPLEEEDFGPPPSRLSGLRNMLVSLGRRSLIEQEYGADEADTEPRFERATVRPAFHEAPTTKKEPAGSASAPVRVTAPPEFLPPQPAAEGEREKEPLRPTPPVPRRERESPDEIQTLPSWRGQYRKKRYPPI
jgi:hypothetical protein